MSARPPQQNAAAAFAATVVLGVLLSATAVSAETQERRALLPTTGEVLTTAFAKMKPALVLQGADIDHDHVTATVCDGAAPPSCFAVRLEDPRLGCEGGEVMGAFCVRFPAGAPSQVALAAMRPALAESVGAVLWIEEVPAAEARPDEVQHSVATSPTRGPQSTSRMIATALLALVLPLLAGAMLGASLRVLAGHRVRGASAPVLAFVIPAALVLLLGPRQRVLGMWDALLAVVLSASAFVLTAHRAFEERAVRVLVVVSVAIGLVISEAAVRLALPPPPSFPPPREARLFFDAAADARPRSPGGQEVVCDMFYGSGWTTGDREDRGLAPQTYAPPRARERRVLHIGDSMVFGVGVDSKEAYPALLERAEPGSVHVNAGVPATGPDGYLLLLRGWVERLQPDLVVFTLFAGNDLDDIDRPYPCCEGGPLLRYDGPSPVPRCPMPSDIESSLRLYRYRRESAPPYLFRVLTGVSAAASYATAAFAPWSNSIAADEPRHDVAREHLEAILKAARADLAARRIPLVVLVLPMRPALESALRPDPPAVDRYWRRAGAEMHEAAEKVGIPVLDAWDLFETVVRERGSAPVFADRVHFSAEGHAILARWLREQLPTAEAAARARIATSDVDVTARSRTRR